MDKNRRNIILFLTILITTFAIIVIIPTLSRSNINTIKPEKIIYEKKYSFNSVIIRDEVVQFDNSDISEIEKMVSDNKMVPKGSYISRVVTTDGQNHEIYSNCSGFVSYQIDGFENIGIDSIKSMNEKDFDYLFDEQPNENIKGIKIIDSYEWYLIVDVDDNTYDNYKDGDIIKIQIENGVNRYLDTSLIAKLKTENHNILILKSNNFIQEFLDQRKLKVNLILIQEGAYKLPNTALTQNDGVVGVFIKEYYGVVGFRPVEIIDSDDDFIYVNLGDDNGNIVINDKIKRTIDEHSEIILAPKSVEYDSIIR
ncbi:MAG TPA: HlyD family efflux transporter periplasmic adaptor subunit [Soehngenia sp.]|nr:HlyD family efflux transporter periplasmic adaptor subunit [Soehngenia sp.]HPP31338.1 HlyD family efflux transporter periplasmic adaptor subunit [Soehngenia sp.]